MKIKAGTAARTAILALALLNQILAAMGYNVIDVSNDEVNTFVSTAFTIVSAIVAWWKNNSFTKAAIFADTILKEEKNNGK